MLWILRFCALYSAFFVPTLQNNVSYVSQFDGIASIFAPPTQGNTGRLSALTLTYDHCRLPQVLNRTTFTCVCPEPLIKQEDDCVCVDCVYSNTEDEYQASRMKELPTYLSEVLQVIDEEERFKESGDSAEASEQQDDGVSLRFHKAADVSDRKKSHKPYIYDGDEYRFKFVEYLRRIKAWKKYIEYLQLLACDIELDYEDQNIMPTIDCKKKMMIKQTPAKRGRKFLSQRSSYREVKRPLPTLKTEQQRDFLKNKKIKDLKVLKLQPKKTSGESSVGETVEKPTGADNTNMTTKQPSIMLEQDIGVDATNLTESKESQPVNTAVDPAEFSVAEWEIKNKKTPGITTAEPTDLLETISETTGIITETYERNGNETDEKELETIFTTTENDVLITSNVQTIPDAEIELFDAMGPTDTNGPTKSSLESSFMSKPLTATDQVPTVVSSTSMAKEMSLSVITPAENLTGITSLELTQSENAEENPTEIGKTLTPLKMEESAPTSDKSGLLIKSVTEAPELFIGVATNEVGKITSKEEQTNEVTQTAIELNTAQHPDKAIMNMTQRTNDTKGGGVDFKPWNTNQGSASVQPIPVQKDEEQKTTKKIRPLASGIFLVDIASPEDYYGDDFEEETVVLKEDTTEYTFQSYEEMDDNEVPASFSDSLIGGHTHGMAAKDEDRAVGRVSGLKGTGSLSMATGGGSAGGAAFTGQGDSFMQVKSKGAAATGLGFIGEKAYRGSSVSSLLVGEGDVVSLNSQGKESSASATAVATKESASAGTAAVGGASASAAATPGKEAASSDATFGETLQSVASVKGKQGPVAESSSVSDKKKTLQQVILAAEESKDHHKMTSRPIMFLKSDIGLDELFGDDEDYLEKNSLWSTYRRLNLG